MSQNDPLFVSQSNRKGVYYFLLIALVIVFLPRVIMFFSHEENFEISSSEITVLKKKQEWKQKTYYHKSYRSKKKQYRSPASKFDPNLYQIKDWMKLGLTEKQSAVVVKFCARGIYSNDQLKKIFVIPEELYSKIKDSTFYPLGKENKFDQIVPREIIRKKVLVELNGASQEDLEQIPGIGPFYAKNILKYRDRLGGFMSKEQLLEVWKMDATKYEEIESFVEVNKTLIRKININEATAEKFKQHPYLNWNIANSLVKIRNKKIRFNAVEEIKESVLMDEEQYDRIKHYLTL